MWYNGIMEKTTTIPPALAAVLIMNIAHLPCFAEKVHNRY